MAFMRPVTPSLSEQYDAADDGDDLSASLPVAAVRVYALGQPLSHYQVVAVKAGREEQRVPFK